jgi:hypothetical protein
VSTSNSVPAVPQPDVHRIVMWTLWHPRPDVPDMECIAVGQGSRRELRLVQGGLALFTEDVAPGESLFARSHRLREHFEAKGFVVDAARASGANAAGPGRRLPETPGVAAHLVALTDQARQSIGADSIALKRLPFRVGREARLAPATPQARERRKGLVPPTNDIYLVECDPHERFQISRQHFQIERRGTGYVVVDRGSDRGTVVGGTCIGGQGSGGAAPLHDLDVIIVGSDTSPFLFTFRLHR